MTTKHLLALFLTIALAACGGGGNNDDGKDPSPRDSDPIGDPVTPNDPTTPAYIGGGGSQIRLGLVTGATVSFYIYGDLSQSILTTTSTTLAELEMSLGPAAFGSLSDEEKLQQAGKIDLHGFEFEPDTWYLAVTEGGEDIDVDGNRQIDAAGTPIKGQIHGVLQGRHINNGQYNLSLLTELAYQSIEARLAKTGSAVQQAYAALPTTDLQEPANQAAAQLVHDLVDGQATYIDLISWRPGSENLQPAMQQTLQTNITGQLRAGDDMSAIIQQALRETTTIRYNPYWYSQAQGIPSHLDGTWILIGHMVYTSQTEAGPITQHYLTRHTLRVSKDQDRMDIYRFQMCGNLHDWTDIVSLPVLDTLRFRFGLYEFWRQADGTYDVTFAFDSPDNTIKGNFIAIRRSASPEASFGNLTITANTIDYDRDDGELANSAMFADETFPVSCFAEQMTTDPKPSIFNAFNPGGEQLDTLAAHRLKVGFGEHHMNIYSEIIPGGTANNPNQGHIASIAKGSWDEEGIASRNEFNALGGANLAQMSGLYENEKIRLQSQFHFKTPDTPTDIAPPEANGTLLLDP